MTHSSYILFAEKIKRSGWRKTIIKRKFLKQVEKTDYQKSDLPDIIEYLVSLAEKR